MKIFEICLLILFATFGVCCALGATEPAFSLQKDYLGVSGYPRIVGLLLAAFCLWGLLRRLLSQKISSGTISTRSLRQVTIAAGLAIAYVAGISWLGFIISTFIYLCIMPCLLAGSTERAVLLKNMLYACCVTGVIEAFFKIFKIYLPSTILF